MIKVTEQPNDGLEETPKQGGGFTYSGSRIFDVVEEDDPIGSPLTYTTAKAALLDQKGVWYNEPYDDDHLDVQVVAMPFRHNRVAGMFTFTARYSNAIDGDSFMANPPKVAYTPTFYSYISDRDANGVPMVNLANVPYREGIQLDEQGCEIEVRVPANEFDVETLLYGLNDTVNNADITLPDGNVIKAGTGLFKCPRLTSKAVTVDYFWINLTWLVRKKGWKYNIVNQGQSAWGQYTSGEYFQGRITTGPGGGGVDGDVALGYTGIPIDPKYQHVEIPHGPVRDTVATPITAPSSTLVSPLVADGGLSTLNASANTGYIVLSFAKYKEADHSPLVTW